MRFKFIFAFCLLLFATHPSFANEQTIKNTNKKAVAIVLGAGNQIDQEYSPFLKELNSKGYEIEIHSFDTKYADNDYRGLNYDISVLENNKWIKSGLLNEKFKNINHIVYEELQNSHITSKYSKPNNTVNLIRYGAKVNLFNKAGVFIKNLVKLSVESNDVVLFVDSFNCSAFQFITVELFRSFKDKAIFLHAVHEFVQPVTTELIDNIKCDIKPEDLFACQGKMDKNVEKIFIDIQKIAKISLTAESFNKLTREQKTEFRKAIIDYNNNTLKVDFTGSCISQALKTSKFNKIDKDVVAEYIGKVALSKI